MAFKHSNSGYETKKIHGRCWGASLRAKLQNEAALILNNNYMHMHAQKTKTTTPPTLKYTFSRVDIKCKPWKS